MLATFPTFFFHFLQFTFRLVCWSSHLARRTSKMKHLKDTYRVLPLVIVNFAIIKSGDLQYLAFTGVLEKSYCK